MAAARILIVEDSRTTVLYVRTCLERLGYVVLGAVAFGEEAIEKAGEMWPDLVLMDINLQGTMNGVEAAGQIRAQFDIPVVYMTARSDEAILQQVKATEPYGYLLKPFKERELRITIEVALHAYKLKKELREREQALRESQQLLERMFASLREAIFIIDADTVEIIDCNPAASEVFGYSREGMIGRTTAFLHVDEAALQEFRDHLYPAVEAKGYLFLPEFRMKRKDGAIFPTEHSVMPLEDEEGKWVGWVSVVRDITGRVRAEETLRLLSSAAEQSREGLAMADLEGNLLFVNNAFAVAHGYAPEELVGRHLSIFHTPEQMPEVEAANRQIRETGEFSGEIWHVRRDGTVFPTSMHNSILRDEAGNPVGMIGTLRDITERKRAEESLRQYAAELKARNEELDAFAHTVAHDLKNPVSQLIGFASALSAYHNSMTDEERERSYAIITRAAHKMDNIIDELLLLSEVRKAEVEPEPLDMARIVAEALQRLEAMIADSQAEIILPDEWPTVLGYSPWVEEVWVNYLSNALKHGRSVAEGVPPQVELGFDEPASQRVSESAGQRIGERSPSESRSTAHSHIRFWVRDNGPGISPEDQAHLFTSFTRLGQAHTGGHGLGLSIVRRIVEKLGGQVGVESQVGQGSVFSFTLFCRLKIESG